MSAHQLPLAREIAARIGFNNLLYVDAGFLGQKFQTVDKVEDIRIVRLESTNREVVEQADIVYTGLRDLDLIERRAALGLRTIYYSERWFKPIRLWGVHLPGSIRMLVPRYRQMMNRFVKWANSDHNARVFAVGPWARMDFIRMGVDPEKIIDWGYFVASAQSSDRRVAALEKSSVLRVLWVGRNLPWKRVNDIERAIELANKSFPGKTERIRFTRLTGVSPDEVRAAMRSHDLYVLASDANEGWGAALNEALEEGMNVVGTVEAGASAAILPPERLFRAGDVRALARLIKKEYKGELPRCSIGEWTASRAADRMLEIVDSLQRSN